MTFSDRVVSFGREVGRGLLHLVYPGICHLCERSLAPGTGAICGPCRDALLGDSLPTCPRCAGTIGPFANAAGGCVSCREVSFTFDSVIRLGPYQAPWRDAVLRLKHHSGEGLAELLGELWASHFRARFQSLHVDCVVPVPLHWWRRWRRGYNQSAALAHGIAATLGLPCHRNWLRRVRNTPAQHLLSPSLRRDNLRGAFRASWRASVRGLSVLLVDDVLTTGSTAHEAAAALRKAGASAIHIAALCRASS